MTLTTKIQPFQTIQPSISFSAPAMSTLYFGRSEHDSSRNDHSGDEFTKSTTINNIHSQGHPPSFVQVVEVVEKHGVNKPFDRHASIAFHQGDQYSFTLNGPEALALVDKAKQMPRELTAKEQESLPSDVVKKIKSQVFVSQLLTILERAKQPPREFSDKDLEGLPPNVIKDLKHQSDIIKWMDSKAQAEFFANLEIQLKNEVSQNWKNLDQDSQRHLEAFFMAMAQGRERTFPEKDQRKLEAALKKDPQLRMQEALRSAFMQAKLQASINQELEGIYQTAMQREVVAESPHSSKLTRKEKVDFKDPDSTLVAHKKRSLSAVG